MKILIPLDGSAQAESLLTYISQLAQIWKAEVLLLRVVDPLDYPALQGGQGVDWRKHLSETETYLQQVATRLAGVKVNYQCRQGQVAATICTVAQECGLIAFAPRGHKGLERWLFGSVAEHVLRDAPCPVLLVRGETNVRFHHLLLPVDTSVRALEVSRRAQFFVPKDIRVTLLHCQDDHDLDQEWCDHLKEEVSSKSGWDLTIIAGKPVKAIVDWAKSSDCDLLAMATRGRGGWEHFWKGSVTEQVSRESPCPVLVFPPDSLQR